MIHDILTNKWITGVVFGLLIISAGCFWYYQHTTAPYKAESEKTDKLLTQRKVDKVKPTVTVDTKATKISVEEILNTAEKSINGTLPKTASELERLNQKILLDWNNFTQDLQRKYPILFNEQELQRSAQTKEGRKKLKIQAEALIEEQLDFYGSMVSQLPPEVATEALNLIEKRFLQNNRGFDPKHLNQAFEKMRTKLK